jgi:hypothetical protein
MINLRDMQHCIGKSKYVGLLENYWEDTAEPGDGMKDNSKMIHRKQRV